MCFGGEGITTKIKVLVLNAVSMFLQKSGLGRQILLSRTCPGKKFCHRNNYYYYLGVTYYCTSLLSPIIPSTEFPSATHDYFNRGCKVFKSGNKYEFSLEYYMMLICLYFLFLFSWSNIVAQQRQFATFPYIAICRDHPRRVYKEVTDKMLVGAGSLLVYKPMHDLQFFCC